MPPCDIADLRAAAPSSGDYDGEPRPRAPTGAIAGGPFQAFKMLWNHQGCHIMVASRRRVLSSNDPSSDRSLLPEFLHGVSELVRTFPREEQLCSFQLDNLFRARDGATQPIR